LWENGIPINIQNLKQHGKGKPQKKRLKKAAKKPAAKKTVKKVAKKKICT